MSLKGKEIHRETSASGEADSADDDRVIPPDITFNILSRLPVKTLLRFKCVSKEWRTLVSRPRFVSAHLTRSPASLIIHALRAPVLAAEEPQPQPGKKAQLIHSDGHVIYVYGPPNPQSRTHSTIDRILDFPGSEAAGFVGPLEFIGGPNGVVCVAQQPFLQMFTLWNPATRSSRLLPSPILKPNPKLHYLSSAGLGFDPSRNEYKVIHIMCHKNINIPDVAEFFSPRAGVWKKIFQPADRPASFWVKKQACEAVVGGVPYWRATALDLYVRGSRFKSQGSLVWFDVRDDVFDWEPYAWANEGREMCFGEIKDCLCVGVWEKGMENNAGLEVWVKEKESGYWIWSKRYRVGPFPRVGAGVGKVVVVGFYGNRVIVEQVGVQGSLIMVDLEKMKEIEGSINGQETLSHVEDLINVQDSLPFTFKTMSYKESLTDIQKLGQNDED